MVVSVETVVVTGYGGSSKLERVRGMSWMLVVEEDVVLIAEFGNGGRFTFIVLKVCHTSLLMPPVILFCYENVRSDSVISISSTSSARI